MNWSIEQAAFIEWCKNGKGSCTLEAVAGSGKTTTGLAGARALKGETLILAYNKKIAEEIAGKTVGESNITSKTVHACGFEAYRKAVQTPKNRIKVDSYKVNNIVDALIASTPAGFDAKDMIDMRPYASNVTKLVGFAKQRAIGIIGSIDDESLWYDIAVHFDVFSMGFSKKGEKEVVPEDDIVRLAIRALKASNDLPYIIDYDDMVYLPVLKGMRFWQYDNVIIDEAQDTNPARRALVRCVVKKGGRVIALGDKHQAIYGFTGADNTSMDLIAEDFNAIRLPLTTTYRCPKAVVKFAQQWVGHIQSGEGSPEGFVGETTMEEFFKRKDLNGESAVLCRLNAPLVELAFRCFRAKIACKVEGRDIGANIKKLVQRWKVTTTEALTKKLDKYMETEITKALAKKNEVKAQQVEDMVSTIKVIIENVNSEGKHGVIDIIAAIDGLFADDVKGILVLSSGHKSKGREWNNVFWLDRLGTCPSKYARQAWQKDQEQNLMYVMATRAKMNLYDLTN